MSREVEKLIGQAVIQYLNGNIQQFRNWSYAAHLEYQRETDRNRLHATIGEIMKYKGVAI